MSIFLTILAGVLTFVFGQIAARLFIEPIQRVQAIIGEISTALINYANVYSNPGVGKVEKIDEASEELRLLASRLAAQSNLIPYYEQVSRLFKLPSRESAYKARSHLIGISNGMHEKGHGTGNRSLGETNNLKANKICELLNIYVPKDEKVYTDNEQA